MSFSSLICSLSFSHILFTYTPRISCHFCFAFCVKFQIQNTNIHVLFRHVNVLFDLICFESICKHFRWIVKTFKLEKVNKMQWQKEGKQLKIKSKIFFYSRKRKGKLHKSQQPKGYSSQNSFVFQWTCCSSIRTFLYYYEGCLLYFGIRQTKTNIKKNLSKYSPWRSFCMRFNQFSKHFCPSDWGIPKTCILNASTASSGVEKRWPLILFFTYGN